MKRPRTLSLGLILIFCTAVWVAEGTTQTIYRPTQGGGYRNPTYAYDGDTATAAVGYVYGSDPNHVTSMSFIYYGFPSGKVSPSSVTLKIANSAQISVANVSQGAVSMY